MESSASHLQRTLTFWPLVFYGLSEIVGAGIYVAIGQVVTRAGEAAPVAFLIAGIAAALTGLCYAELASRFPDAAGAAAYVKHVFGSDRLAQAIGGIMALAVAITAAAIANGAVQYLALLIHTPASVLTAAIILGFTGVAIIGVNESVGLAALLGVIELGGLVAAIAAGFLAAPDFDLAGMMPRDLAAWRGVAAGAFIAFFAFLGFETLANMAEEVKEARRVVPRAILVAIAISIVLYVLVAVAVTLADRAGASPLVDLFEGRNATIFAAASAMAIVNGVLVGIVMLSRLFYGLARNGQLPAAIGAVSLRRGTPTVATLLAGGIILVTALAVPFGSLLVWTNAWTLMVFVAVDLALWRLQQGAKAPQEEGFQAPRWIPPLAALLSLGLMMAELLG
jgi:basic amino acid/polyamine antiporter, APA family